MADEPRSLEMIECIVAHPRENITNCNHFNRLCDELLREILLRLPDCKNVIRSMCVSRRWGALASHASFPVDFIRFKLENANSVNLNNQHETFAFITVYNLDQFPQFWQHHKSFFKPSIFELWVSLFTSADSLKEDENAPGSTSTLFASCQDLLLYNRIEKDKYDLYVCNVLTRESVMLPSPPFECTSEGHISGFICDPLYYSNGRDISINTSYNYTVVIFQTRINSSMFRAHLFSSHCDTQWCKKVFSLPEPFDLGFVACQGSYSFCLDGKLHFAGGQGFFGFDHNSIGPEDEIQCHLIKWPIDLLRESEYLGVSQGRLYVSSWYHLGVDKDTFNIWVLENYKAGSWMFQHRIELNEWVPRQPFITDVLKKFSPSYSKIHTQSAIRVLGMHPSSSDTIYLVVPGYVFLCNLSTKSLELACRFPAPVVKQYNFYLTRFLSFLVIFNIWPTPLSPFTQHKVGFDTNSSRALGAIWPYGGRLKPCSPGEFLKINTIV